MKRILWMRARTALFAIVAFAASAAVPAAIGTIDTVPAATLLLPYFEVDLANPNGPVTVFQMMNRSASSALAQVTLWTDLGVPTYTFDIYMTGYDQVEVDLRLLFNGILPQTSNTLSSQGAFSTPPLVFPNCAGILAQGRLSPATVTGLRNAHTGAASTLLGGSCGGTVSGNIARGYITIDNVNQCSTTFPSQAGYFVTGGLGVANNSNVLFGEYWFNDRANNFAYGDTLVHIEASGTDPLTTTPGKYTFYGRLLPVPGSAADNRESLPTNLLARHVNGGVFNGTDALVWRDPGSRPPFTCGNPPAGLTRRSLAIFDEQEHVVTTASGFPRAAERVNLADPARIPIPFSFGFIYYDLNLLTAAPPFGGINQGWVSHVFRANGRFAGLVPGWAFDNAGREVFGSPGQQLGECADGLDNDGDGKIDLADTGCSSLSDTEAPNPECSDGIDNDGDGKIDFPADPGCASVFDNFEAPNPACSDGIDNDGDGLTDFPSDPGCASATSNLENPQCNNGADDDGDTLIDLADAGCSGPADNSELNPQCNNGVDDDGDTLIDFPNDPGCTDANDNSELIPQCSDGIDNDGDGKIDFPADVGCTNANDNTELGTTQCSDGLDNDGDGLIDAADPGCASATDLNEKPATITRACSDTVDNDGDGFIDYPADTGCISRYDDNEVTPN